MQIYGLNKTTLLDYPKHLAATIFLGGCNMRCPFCHNASLVTGLHNTAVLPEEEVFHYLSRRQGILEGVCITGGEPTLYHELPAFIRKIKSLGFKVKLDTNGTNPALMKSLATDGLIDYIAMDIKNAKEKYPISSGIKDLDISSVEESVSFLLSGSLDYEFRTTIVRELHTREDMISIGEWIRDARAYYLQSYLDSGDILSPGFHSHSKDILQNFVDLVSPYVEYIALRGVD